MNTTTWVLLACMFLLGMLVSLIPKKGSSNKKFKYQKRPNLLTNHELKFYRELQPAAAGKKLVICPKVRLADLIEPKKGQPSWQAAFNKIQAKHIDFVLCDPGTMQPVLAVELDDNTHDRKDRTERDNFVDKALQDAGLPILHTRTANGLPEAITKAIVKKSR